MIPMGAAVRDRISGWHGKVVRGPSDRPRGTLAVLLEGTTTTVIVDEGNLVYVARDYASVRSWDAVQRERRIQS